MPSVAKRIIVVSDLHLGGDAPRLNSRPGLLADFIAALPQRARGGERIELVIAGDFIDFLAIAPVAAFTPDAFEIRAKLERTRRDPAFAPVFDALARHVAGGHELTILVGNHDVELALPPGQDALLSAIGATPHDVLFVDDGRAYRVGRALIEHGNRYDPPNLNDWDGLRALASYLSRFEPPPPRAEAIEVSPGSLLVERVINPIKARYPFIDQLKPEGELVAFLILAFEPRLGRDIDKLARLLHAKWLSSRNPDGRAPGVTENVALAGETAEDPALRQLFGEDYDALRSPREEVALSDWLPSIIASRDSLSTLCARPEPLPADRLRKVRAVMKRLLLDDRSAAIDGPTEQYGEAADRMVEQSVGDIEVVVMGHTHHARQVRLPSGGVYLNSGTWADVIRVPDTALDGDTAEADAALEQFLRDLVADRRRPVAPTWAELRVEPEGRVSEARVHALDGAGDGVRGAA